MALEVIPTRYLIIEASGSILGLGKHESTICRIPITRLTNNVT
jgi:hypothetical protein